MARDETIKLSLIDGVTKNLTAIRQGVTGLGASIVTLNQAAELTGKAFGALGAIAGKFGDAVSSTASVEDALTRVYDITKATAAEQTGLQAAIRDAVDTTRFSVEEAAGALLLMSEDGFSASQAIDELGRVLAYAQANALGAADATNALGGVLDTYSEKPQIIGELADKLTAVSRAAGVGTKALQEGLIAIGVTAEQANIPLDDAIGYLGLLATKGLEGSKGVKALTTVIRDIQDPASKAGKALNDLGLEGADFAAVLAKVGSDSGAAEKLLLAFTGKSRDALKALLTQGGGDLGQFADIIKNAGGESKRAADVLNNTFQGALDRITNQLALTRNELLTPILGPLADEIQTLSTRLSNFAKSEDFSALVGNFTRLATEGISALGSFIEGIKFDDAVSAVVGFSTTLVDSLDTIATAVVATGKVIATFSDSIAIVFNALKAIGAEAGAALALPLTAFSNDAQATFNDLRQTSIDAQNDIDKSLSKIGNRFGSTAKEASGLKKGFDDAGSAARTAAVDFKALESALPKKNDIADIAERFGLIKNPVKEAGDVATVTAEEYFKLKQSIDELALAAERNKVAVFSAAIADLYRAGIQGGATMEALSNEVKKAEENIRKLTESGDQNKKSTDDQAKSVRNLSDELRNLGSAQDSAVDGNRRLSNSNSQVSDSFGNVGQASNEVTISLGNLNEAYVQQALAAAGASGTIQGYLNTLNSWFEAGARQEEQIRRAIDVAERQNQVLSDEDRIRRQLEEQYGTSSSLLDELVKKKLELLRASRENNDETQREIDLEKAKAAGVAGGLGKSAAGDSGTAATAGKGTQAGPSTGKTSGDSPAVIVNVSGAPTDAAGWRDIVSRYIVPELARINRLSR
jgi:TP901 family phage tail tape measure protein